MDERHGRRNIRRFPENFMFELTADEWSFLRSQIVTLENCRGKHPKYPRFAFTEQGVSMRISIFIRNINYKESMATATEIRNRVIDQLMTIKDAGYLQALSDMIRNSHVHDETIGLTEEQKIMLAMSEEDIKAGRTSEQQMLHERELRWLKGK